MFLGISGDLWPRRITHPLSVGHLVYHSDGISSPRFKRKNNSLCQICHQIHYISSACLLTKRLRFFEKFANQIKKQKTKNGVSKESKIAPSEAEVRWCDDCQYACICLRNPKSSNSLVKCCLFFLSIHVYSYMSADHRCIHPALNVLNYFSSVSSI